MYTLVDPPVNDFSPLAERKAWLAEMIARAKSNPDDEGIALALSMAREMLEDADL